MNKVLKILDFTAEKAQSLAASQSVMGDPMVVGEVTIVPVSAVSFGFAGGGSDLPSKKKADAALAGSGASISKTPLSFLAVCGNEVQVLHVAPENSSKESLLSALAPLAQQLQEYVKSKKATKNAAAK